MRTFVYSYILLLFCTTTAIAQISDLSLLNTKEHTLIQYEQKREVKYLFANHKNVIIKYNPLSLVLGGMLYVYQKVIAQQIGANCPYEISCSAYAKQSIQRWGLAKGLPLTADRLMRCTKLASVDIKSTDYTKDGRIIDNPNKYTFKPVLATHSH